MKVHKKYEVLGDIIKAARKKADMTVEILAEKVERTDRYIYQIENEGQIPSFDVLYKIVRLLSIPPELIFYPEKPSKDSEVENLLRMLSVCDERSLEVVKATVKALIDTTLEKQPQGCFFISVTDSNPLFQLIVCATVSVCLFFVLFVIMPPIFSTSIVP